MKISKRDYTILANAITAAMQKHSSHTIESYASQGLSVRRYCWDLLHASHVRITSAGTTGRNGDLPLYDYLNDDHITTALRRIVAHNNRNMEQIV